MVVFSRMGSITALVTCFIYVFSYLYNNEDVKYFMKHLGVFAEARRTFENALAAFLAITGQVEYFINNIFRLSGIASTAGSGYSIENLWSTFIFGNGDCNCFRRYLSCCLHDLLFIRNEYFVFIKRNSSEENNPEYCIQRSSDWNCCLYVGLCI